MKLIGEMLIEEGYIARSTLEKALELQKNNDILFGEALMTLDAITKDELITFLNKHKDHDEVKEWAGLLLSQNEVDKIFNKQK